jgi:hypothetical protein
VDRIDKAVSTPIFTLNLGAPFEVYSLVFALWYPLSVVCSLYAYPHT